MNLYPAWQTPPPLGLTPATFAPGAGLSPGVLVPWLGPPTRAGPSAEAGTAASWYLVHQACSRRSIMLPSGWMEGLLNKEGFMKGS